MQYSLYPEIEPYNTGTLKVSDIHTLFYEEVGNPLGVPVVVLHGGPGGGCKPFLRQYFDPRHYRIILFDQRGAGRSTPHAELRDNTTWHLVDDIENLRKHLKIDRWIVFGGSWGSTLSLVYAETHPANVMGLCLRGIFLCRKEEIDWFYQEGASFIYPDTFKTYQEFIPSDERGNMLKAYYRRVTGDDEKLKLAAAKHWSIWEGSASKLIPDEDSTASFGEDKFALAFARIETHYFYHNAFLDEHQGILENADKINGIPCEMVHGRYDIVCPIKNAFDLKERLPKARLHVIMNAGHAVSESGITAKLIEIMEEFKRLV